MTLVWCELYTWSAKATDPYLCSLAFRSRVDRRPARGGPKKETNDYYCRTNNKGNEKFLLDKYLIDRRRCQTGSQSGQALPSLQESVAVALAAGVLGLAVVVICSCWRCRRWQSRVRGLGQQMPFCAMLVNEVEINERPEGYAANTCNAQTMFECM